MSRIVGGYGKVICGSGGQGWHRGDRGVSDVDCLRIMAAAGSRMYMIPGDVLVRSGIPGQSNVILGAELDLAKAAKKKDQPFGRGYVRPWRDGVMEVPSNIVIISNHCARKLINPAPEMLPFFDSRIAIFSAETAAQRTVRFR